MSLVGSISFSNVDSSPLEGDVSRLFELSVSFTIMMLKTILVVSELNCKLFNIIAVLLDNL